MKRIVRTLLLVGALIASLVGSQLSPSAPSFAAPSNVPLCADAACAGAPKDGAEAATVLLDMYARGQLEIDESKWGGPSIRTRELIPISQRTVSAECNVDPRALQEIVIVARKFGKVKISDLNRRCSGGIPQCDIEIEGTAPTPTSPHCAPLPTAVDYTGIGGRSVTGGNKDSTDLLVFLNSFVPYGAAAGQRTRCSAPAASLSNFTYLFDDLCNHQHVDLRSAGGTSLNIPSCGGLAPAGDPAAAFQANTGALFTWGAAGSGSTGQGMMAGTSPSIARLAGGSYVEAFQSSTGYLYVWGAGGGYNTGQGMMAGTSPSITGTADGGWTVAFQSNTGYLVMWGPNGGYSTGQGLKAGTSPAIAATGTAWTVAFHSSTGYLYMWGPNGGYNTGQGMMSGTSPAIAGIGTSWTAAFHSTTGYLYMWGENGGYSTGQGMMSGTSPAVGATGSAWTAAFHSNSGYLYLWGENGGYSTGQGMKSGTSPAMAS